MTDKIIDNIAFFFWNFSENNLIGIIEKIVNETKELTDKGQINLSKADINNLYKLQSKRIYWSDKFLELSKITPADMVIT